MPFENSEMQRRVVTVCTDLRYPMSFVSHKKIHLLILSNADPTLSDVRLSRESFDVRMGMAQGERSTNGLCLGLFQDLTLALGAVQKFGIPGNNIQAEKRVYIL